jgi:3-methyl-2-oxobutanoate hydroxymethyltransferase
VMLTAYDANMARAIERAGADLILVGDSLGRAVLGYQDENEVSLSDMIHHAKAVLRGRKTIPVIVDLPFNTYNTPAEALDSAQRVMAIGADFVKLEGPLFAVISELTQHQIPVVAHLGYTPQTANKTGSKVVGKDCETAENLLQDCLKVEQAGACMLVIEMVPREVSSTIAQQCRIPVIGIGCGPDTDGQVLVTPDMWGENDAPFKFLHRFGEVLECKTKACSAYAKAVRERSYPADENAFHMKKSDLELWNQNHSQGKN